MICDDAHSQCIVNCQLANVSLAQNYIFDDPDLQTEFDSFEQGALQLSWPSDEEGLQTITGPTTVGPQTTVALIKFAATELLAFDKYAKWRLGPMRDTIHDLELIFPSRDALIQDWRIRALKQLGQKIAESETNL